MVALREEESHVENGWMTFVTDRLTGIIYKRCNENKPKTSIGRISYKR